MAKKAQTSVTVVMPVLNEEHHLEAAVASVLSQKYDGPLELFLALGPSSDNTNKIAKRLAKADSRIRLSENLEGLTTVGLNRVIRESTGDVIVRVDAHSEPMPGYIARGVEILNETGADLLGGIMDAKGKTPFQQAVAWAYTSRFGIGGAVFHVGGEAGEAESAYLGIFRRSALERVGGYDETIIRGEDWDLAQRIKRTGGLVWFSPELKVTYWPRAEVGLLAKQFYSTGVWRGELTKRDFKAASKRYFIPPLLVVSVILGFPIPLYLLGVGLLALTATSLSSEARWRLFLVLPTMHFSWGWGFIVGLAQGASMNTIDKSRVR